MGTLAPARAHQPVVHVVPARGVVVEGVAAHQEVGLDGAEVIAQAGLPLVRELVGQQSAGARVLAVADARAHRAGRVVEAQVQRLGAVLGIRRGRCAAQVIANAHVESTPLGAAIAQRVRGAVARVQDGGADGRGPRVVRRERGDARHLRIQRRAGRVGRVEAAERHGAPAGAQRDVAVAELGRGGGAGVSLQAHLQAEDRGQTTAQVLGAAEAQARGVVAQLGEAGAARPHVVGGQPHLAIDLGALPRRRLRLRGHVRGGEHATHGSQGPLRLVHRSAPRSCVGSENGADSGERRARPQRYDGFASAYAKSGLLAARRATCKDEATLRPTA